MTNLTIPQVRALMNKPTNIRNISIIGHVGHGKSAFTDSLVSKAGIIPPPTAGLVSLTDARDDEKQRAVLAKSTAFVLYFDIDEDELLSIKQNSDGNRFLVNLIDLPRHSDFSSEVTAALRITDGVLIVVDCVNGVCLQTETVLRQALAERVKPVIIINNVDRAIFELQVPKKDLYQSLQRTIASINDIISTYHDATLGDVRVYPENGTVIFQSGSNSWGFHLSQFASRYATKFGVDKQKLTRKLWGENFYDPAIHKWTTKGTTEDGKQLERGFEIFVLGPIYKIFDTVMNYKNSIEPILDKHGIKLSQKERDLKGQPLVDAIMRKFLPAADSLLQTILTNLPSPITAQQYRAESLYEGPMGDESSISIRNCDPKGPLVVYVSKMLPSSDRGRFFALGRVFSGTVSAGVTIRIQGPNYVPGKRIDLFIKKIQQTALMMGHSVEPIEDCPSGNIVGLVGIDQFLLRSGTLTNSETTYNIKAMNFSVSPVVQVAVEVRSAADLPQLIEGLKHLSKSDPCVQTWVADSGEHIVAGASELHLEVCLKELEGDYAGVPLKKCDLAVGYRETVKAKSSIVALSKSPNRHNRVYLTAEPLSDKVTYAIETGKISARDDFKMRAHLMADDYGWDVTDARKIWCFGPDTTGPNLLVDVTKGVQFLSEIKDYCISAFQWATKEGVCAEEPMRGIRFNIIDVMMFSDAIHRGNGQILPTFRRVVYAASLLADPGLQEPVYLLEIQCPEDGISGVYTCLSKRRGQIISEEKRLGLGTPVFTIRAYLPVVESFGFSADLRSATQGQAFSQSVFDRWETMNGSPLEKGSKVEALVHSIRKRKGIRMEIPPLDRYLDKL